METKQSADHLRRTQSRELFRTLASHQPTYPAKFEQDSYHVPCSCGAKVDAGPEIFTLNDARDAFASHQAEQIELLGSGTQSPKGGWFAGLGRR